MPKAYLTFDDGVGPSTPIILDALKAIGAPATFFVISKNVYRHSAQSYLQRIVREGHQVGNHTYNHQPFYQWDYQSAYLDDTGQKFRNKEARDRFGEDIMRFGQELYLFYNVRHVRLPGVGAFIKCLVDEAQSLIDMPMRHVRWDFEFGPESTAWLPATNWNGLQGISATTEDLPPDNAVILFHEHHWKETRVLQNILEVLQANNFEFAPLP